jgi:oleate hydratase
VSDRTAYVIGGGVAGLAAAVFLVRDGRLRGDSVRIFEQNAICGGSLDASGDAATGYLMRGERMFSRYFDCLFDLLDQIPSYDDPNVSARDDIFAFTRQANWRATLRLVDSDGRAVDLTSMGLDLHDRLALLRLMTRSEAALGAQRIVDVLPPHFFETNFWFLWRTMFAFQPWHSAVEMRRYLLHFIYAFPTIRDMSSVHLTRYTQYHSIIAPLVKWLSAQGVRFETDTRVDDIAFHDVADRHEAKALATVKDGARAMIEVKADDLVIFTNGSMTSAAGLSSTRAPAPLDRKPPGDCWALWEKISRRRRGFGRPETFISAIDKTKWLAFTATTAAPLLRHLVETKTGVELGRAGLISFKASKWLLTLKFNYFPAYPDQPKDVVVWWGYGLNPDAEGDFVTKKMADCTGEELLRESFLHLGFADDLDALMQRSQAIPCMMPYITSQFMPRAIGDRPKVVPDGSVNFAFVGQFCETPDDTVFTVEYSVRTAKIAVKTLLKSDMAVPPFRKFWRNPLVLWRAFRETMR